MATVTIDVAMKFSRCSTYFLIVNVTGHRHSKFIQLHTLDISLFITHVNVNQTNPLKTYFNDRYSNVCKHSDIAMLCPMIFVPR